MRLGVVRCRSGTAEKILKLLGPMIELDSVGVTAGPKELCNLGAPIARERGAPVGVEGCEEDMDVGEDDSSSVDDPSEAVPSSAPEAACDRECPTLLLSLSGVSSTSWIELSAGRSSRSGTSKIDATLPQR